MINNIIKGIILNIIPTIVRHLMPFYKKGKHKQNKENVIILTFSYKIKIIVFIVSCLVAGLTVWSKKNDNGYFEACCCLLISMFAANMYFIIKKITIFKDKEYFEYRNMFFYTKKIYYKDIKSIQAIMEGLHISMNDGTVMKIMDINWLGYGTLVYYCKKNDVEILPRKNFKKIKRN